LSSGDLPASLWWALVLTGGGVRDGLAVGKQVARFGVL
jgi:hypothetical protein